MNKKTSMVKEVKAILALGEKDPEQAFEQGMGVILREGLMTDFLKKVCKSEFRRGRIVGLSIGVISGLVLGLLIGGFLWA